MMISFGEKIKTLRKEKGITQCQIADKLSITQSAYQRYEKGINYPTSETLIKIANIFGVTTDYLLDDKQIDPKPKIKGYKIPVLGSIPAGIPIEAIEEILDYEEIPSEWEDKGEFFGLKVKGNSMEPRICNGDVVIVRKQDDAESGDICICMVNGFDATLKQIKKETNGILLVPFNPEYSSVFYDNKQIASLPVRIIGKVVELRGKF